MPRSRHQRMSQSGVRFEGRAAYAGAFTLIELLVVISIITLLISILLPALKNARTSGQRLQGLSNVRQLAMAMRMYTDDSKGSFPYSILDVPLASGGISGNLESWAHFLRSRGNVTGYISDYRVFWSPARSQEFAESQFKTNANFGRPGFAVYQRGLMPWESSGKKPMILDQPGNPPPSNQLLFIEAFDISYFYPQQYDGKGTVDPQSLDGIYFTYNGTVTRAYVDGHGSATVAEDMGWKPFAARDGEWMRTGYGQTVVSPNANLLKAPYYRR